MAKEEWVKAEVLEIIDNLKDENETKIHILN